MTFFKKWLKNSFKHSAHSKDFKCYANPNIYVSTHMQNQNTADVSNGKLSKFSDSINENSVFVHYFIKHSVQIWKMCLKKETLKYY